MAVVDSQGVSIFYEDSGTGWPVVLGHSFLCSGEMWREQVTALRAKYRMINPDFRGHGRSGLLAHSFSLYDAVEDVIAVLDQLEIDRATWCGLSIGGMVALRAALRYPDRVAGLILLDTDAGAETVLRKLKYRAMGLGARALGLGPLSPSIARLMFGATTRRHNPTLVAEWKRQLGGFHVPSLLHCLEALMRRDSLHGRLGEIETPTLVLVGTEDRSLPPALSRRIHDGLHHSTLREIPHAGHLSALERPAPVTDAILAFLTANAN